MPLIPVETLKPASQLTKVVLEICYEHSALGPLKKLLLRHKATEISKRVNDVWDQYCEETGLWCRYGLSEAIVTDSCQNLFWWFEEEDHAILFKLILPH